MSDIPRQAIPQTELERRRLLITCIREIIQKKLVIEDADTDSVLSIYRCFYLQISFSEVHPLMVFSIARFAGNKDLGFVAICNEMNLNSVLGSHAFNEDTGFYIYRATHWLETEIDADRFFEILDRCVDEATKGFFQMTA